MPSSPVGGNVIQKLLPWTESFRVVREASDQGPGMRVGGQVGKQARPASTWHPQSLPAEQNCFDFFYILMIPYKILKNSSIFF